MGSLKPELFNLQVDNGIDNKRQFSTSRQYSAVLCMNLLTFSYGFTCGWLSGALIIFNSDETPLITKQLKTEEIGWIASAIAIGGFVANLFFGWLSERTGRKVALYVVVVPQLLSWIFVYYARTPFYLVVSRILGGFAGGGLFTLVPLYTAEISDDKVRGVLGSFLVLICNAGLLFAYICGGYFDYYTQIYMIIPFSAAFILLFAKYPDSPTSLIKRKLFDEAEKSFLFYRSIEKYSREAKSLFEDNVLNAQSNDEKDNKISVKDFASKSSKKAITYGIALMVLNQFCGCFAMVVYAASIFQISGSNLSPVNSTIIVGSIQIVGALFASLFVERAGRKFMMIISSFGIAIGFSSLGMYLYLQTIGMKFEGYSFIPLVAFSSAIFLGNLGVITLPFMILNEISPPKIRGFTSVLCMSVLWICVFSVIKYLPNLIEIMELHGVSFLFALNSFIGGVFIVICIPETKGRSVEEIMKIMDK
ncbi:facilitated trehalose transporter Tret1-like [Chironomus tepperi]|uniref:facilitated trehalose transporter Tret1-like n=1 Tax=Chironomus tepperi TaxID=113505 RepID=UPI00391F056D